MADFYGQRGLFVEHIELDFCDKFEVNWFYGVHGLSKFSLFWAVAQNVLITAMSSDFVSDQATYSIKWKSQTFVI